MELVNGIDIQNGMIFGPTINLGPERMCPFPFVPYYIDSNAGSTGSYYNNPSLDATKLKITLGGDNNAWSDPGSFYDLNYLTPAEAANPVTSFYASGGKAGYNEFYMDVKYDGWRWLSYFEVDDPTQKVRYSLAGQDDPGPGAQIIYMPGVASVEGFFTSSGVVYQDSPVWFELEFQENEAKTNPSLFYSRYTNFGDFSEMEFPEIYESPYPVGYTRRFVGGIINKDANLATCTTADIIAGAIWNATDLGGGVYSGTGHVVVNGNIKESFSTAERPSRVIISMDPITEGSVTEIGCNPQQCLNGIYIEAGAANYSVLGYAYWEPDYPAVSTDSIDVFDVKYGWYLDFVPDAGPGSTAGIMEWRIPMMYTHPGWPV